MHKKQVLAFDLSHPRLPEVTSPNATAHAEVTPRKTRSYLTETSGIGTAPCKDLCHPMSTSLVIVRKWRVSGPSGHWHAHKTKNFSTKKTAQGQGSQATLIGLDAIHLKHQKFCTCHTKNLPYKPDRNGHKQPRDCTDR